ncbi:hypothetical protein AB0X98_00975 [Rothia koreensis]|uniref:hypothetical protein n=1 Tax=Rothia koreensis TaxID=592378 RepID=UPI003F21A75F
MHLNKKESQHRRDFVGLFGCEHCGHQQHMNGYDDTYFHEAVIPTITCHACDQQAAPTMARTRPHVAPWAVL